MSHSIAINQSKPNSITQIILRIFQQTPGTLSTLELRVHPNLKGAHERAISSAVNGLRKSKKIVLISKEGRVARYTLLKPASRAEIAPVSTLAQSNRINRMAGTYAPEKHHHRNDGNKHILSKGFPT